MTIYLIYVLPLFTAYICFQVYDRLNSGNKYHLIYLFYHFLSEFFIAINLSLYVSLDVQIPILVMSLIRIASLMFLYLQILSIQKQSKVGLGISDYIILGSILIVNLLNHLDIKILPLSYENVNSGGYFKLGVDYFKGKEDVFITMTLAALYYIYFLLKSLLRKTKSEFINDKISKFLSRWTYTYLILYLIIGLFIICVCFLTLFDLYADTFDITIKILVLARLFVLVSIGFLLKDLSSIKINEITLDQSYFKQIEQYFNTNTHHLDPAFSISKLALDLELRSDVLSKCINENTQMTSPSYINSYRIKYACQLMHEDYLTNFSMLSLAKKCGFNNQQSFNRSFKSVMKLTPSAYLESIKNLPGTKY